MAQPNPSKRQGRPPSHAREPARSETTDRAHPDVDKDDVSRAPESGEKENTPSGAEEPTRDPDEV